MNQVINKEKIASLETEIGADNVLVLIDIFLNELADYQQTLKNALVDARARHIANISHALKSSAGSFGADRLCSLAIDLDTRAKEGRLEDDEAIQALESMLSVMQETQSHYVAFKAAYPQ